MKTAIAICLAFAMNGSAFGQITGDALTAINTINDWITNNSSMQLSCESISDGKTTTTTHFSWLNGTQRTWVNNVKTKSPELEYEFLEFEDSNRILAYFPSTGEMTIEVPQSITSTTSFKALFPQPSEIFDIIALNTVTTSASVNTSGANAVLILDFDPSELEGDGILAASISVAQVKIEYNSSGRVESVETTYGDASTKTQYTYISLDNSIVASAAPSVPPTSLLDVNKSFADAMDEAINKSAE